MGGILGEVAAVKPTKGKWSVWCDLRGLNWGPTARTFWVINYWATEATGSTRVFCTRYIFATLLGAKMFIFRSFVRSFVFCFFLRKKMKKSPSSIFCLFVWHFVFWMQKKAITGPKRYLAPKTKKLDKTKKDKASYMFVVGCCFILLHILWHSFFVFLFIKYQTKESCKKKKKNAVCGPNNLSCVAPYEQQNILWIRYDSRAMAMRMVTFSIIVRVPRVVIAQGNLLFWSDRNPWLPTAVWPQKLKASQEA